MLDATGFTARRAASCVRSVGCGVALTDLAWAQWMVMELLAHGDPRRVELAEKRVAQCAQRLRRAAVGLDRVLVERGDEAGRWRLVEGAPRLATNAAWVSRPIAASNDPFEFQVWRTYGGRDEPTRRTGLWPGYSP